MDRFLGLDQAGTHLAISWLSCLLYMLEVTFAVYHFSRVKLKTHIRCLLFVLVAADTLCMATIFASTWALLVKTEGFQLYTTSDTLWTVPVATFMGTILAVIEEVFLINRCRNLSQHIAITATLLAMVVAHAILSLYSGFYVVTHRDLDPNFVRFGNQAAAISATLAATVDILIPLALLWQLYKVTPTQISRKRSYRDTIINIISSGGIGGILSVILIALFWTRPDVFYIFSTIMGRIYALTLLINILLSKRRSSTSATSMAEKGMTTMARLQRVSTSAEISLMTFTTRTIPIPPDPLAPAIVSPSILSRSASVKTTKSDRNKRLPPTPATDPTPEEPTPAPAGPT